MIKTVSELFGLPLLWQAVDLKFHDAASAVLDLLDQNPGITALVTSQDAGVPDILRAVQARNLRVPADISLIGLFSGLISEILDLSFALEPL